MQVAHFAHLASRARHRAAAGPRTGRRLTPRAPVVDIRNVNISAATIDLFTRHALARSQAALNTALERLATGSKINRASDDPAGVIISERLEAHTRALGSTIERLEIDNARLAAQDGAYGVLSDMAIELEGLTVAAANSGALSEAEREAMQLEADSLLQGMRHVVNTSLFGGQKLIDVDVNDLGALSTLVDDGDGEETLTHTIADLVSGGSLNLVDGDLEMAQRVVSKAVNTLATRRGAIGNQMLENESRIRTSLAELEGTTSALSEIRDTDYYAEISELTRAQIMEQAGLQAILIGRQSRQNVLALLG